MYIVSNVAITLMENSVLILSYAVSIIVKIIKSYNGNQTGLSEIPKWKKKLPIILHQNFMPVTVKENMFRLQKISTVSFHSYLEPKPNTSCSI